MVFIDHIVIIISIKFRKDILSSFKNFIIIIFRLQETPK
jgi:hypothetical protein